MMNKLLWVGLGIVLYGCVDGLILNENQPAYTLIPLGEGNAIFTMNGVLYRSGPCTDEMVKLAMLNGQGTLNPNYCWHRMPFLESEKP